MTGVAPAGDIVGGPAARGQSADDLASAIGGTVLGDGSAIVRRIAPLDRAEPDELSFLAKPQYAPLLKTSRAGVVLVDPELAETPGEVRARIVVAKPYEALLQLLPRFHRPVQRQPGIAPTARIGRGVRLGADVTVGPFAVIGDGAGIGDRSWIEPHVVVGGGVTIGDDCRLHPGVVLHSGTVLGHRVAVHAGARLGSDGFGYVFQDGAHQKLPHVGRCIIGDDVEIGANTTIDRGSVDDTVIGAGTKIDNLVHIAHNVRIGRLCLLMAQVGIAGSAHVGDGVIFAGQSGLAGHREIGARARIAAKAGVISDVPAGETWSGYPARPHREALRASAALFKLADMMRKLERLIAERSS